MQALDTSESTRTKLDNRNMQSAGLFCVLKGLEAQTP